MDERRQGQHRAVHRLSQVYADLMLADNEIAGIDVPEHMKDRKERALMFVRSAHSAVKMVVDRDLGPKLAEKE